MSLNLLDVALAEHLGVLYQFVADLSGSPPVDQRVLMPAQLRLQSTDLKIHFTLVSGLVHLLSQQLLNADAAMHTGAAH